MSDVTVLTAKCGELKDEGVHVLPNKGTVNLNAKE
jgi:hypothetical protein